MNCIIIDDEPLARDGMKNLITENRSLHLVAAFNSTAAARGFLQTNTIDLIFLDIELPDENGLHFAKIIPDDTLVIFTTAYPQYALESYEVDAIDYLVKPIAYERFEQAVNKAVQYQKLLESQQNTFESIAENHVIIKADRRFHKILFDDILFIAGLKDYSVLYTSTDKILTGLNLKTMHSKLPNNKFIRVSKSYVVNKDAISSFDSSTIMINEHEVPIGKIYQAEFYNYFLKK